MAVAQKVVPVELVKPVRPHKHVWVLYHSKKYRQCVDCHKIEAASSFMPTHTR